ncbi:MAG TPA: DNA-directed RNA polymerase subunit L [Candidatus Nanoarchaeia archaeon]|nr:DNA-directed RNA polymerase subunit L [Candidatus Nanoarchaeia archaeon]
MDAKILEDKKRRLVVELKGVNHGFCHAVKKELWNDSAVTLASYVVDHPTIGVPKLLIETNNDEDAKDALKKAIERLKKTTEQFKVELKKVK